MINLRKVGLTALAGSLAAVTAHARDLSVTGSANVTYVTKSGDNTAQSLGHDKDVKFSGSGELDNGWTFAIHTLTKDDFTVSSQNGLWQGISSYSLSYQRNIIHHVDLYFIFLARPDNLESRLKTHICYVLHNQGITPYFPCPNLIQ